MKLPLPSVPIGWFTQDINDLIETARTGNLEITEFDTSCFTGHYATGDISEDYLHYVSVQRSDDAKSFREFDEDTLIDLSHST